MLRRDNGQEAEVLQDLLDGSECTTPEKQAAIGQLAGEMSVVSPESKVSGQLGGQYGQLGGQYGHLGAKYGSGGAQLGYLGGRPPGRSSHEKRNPRVERLSALLQPGRQELKAATVRRLPPLEPRTLKDHQCYQKNNTRM